MLSGTVGDASLLEVMVRAALPLVVLPAALLVVLLLIDRVIVLTDNAANQLHDFPDFPEPVGTRPGVEGSKRAA